MKKRLLEGLITPIMTPFNRDENQSINYEETKHLVDYVIENGVDGIFVLGSNGEFTVVNKKEKIEFTKKVIEFVDERVPVYAGPGCCSTYETVQTAREMEKLGVSALSVISPYFVKLTDSELYEHFKTVAESVNVPVILYNIPRMTGNPISKEVFRKLATVKNIAGIKDSSRDLDNLKNYIEVAKAHDLKVLVGSDGIIMEGYKMGASGAIAGMSNVIPKVMANLFKALYEGNDEAASKYQEEVNYIRAVNKKATMPVVLKRSLELGQIAQVGPARKPAKESSPELDEEIKAMLKHYEILK
ncbi:dihydrodipicolinate synthase family protein [Parablautia sp. Marseille-Q6255]|uniref:dihydrodipicolinate synthase family protein n=1 Tax=Parablautia sp. Marseille-Q6255 TaxID=3039593 RepID=UPI0024BC6C35|nr:dihydrodipicolinate synthase family protein [Parablautia sp. Marseille-Q6255]